MLKKIIKSLYFIILLNFLFLKSASTEIVKSIEIYGNERIADETILMFSKFLMNLFIFSMMEVLRKYL